MDLSHLQDYAHVALDVVGGLITILVVISPLTRSDLDNKALKVLRKVVELGGKLVGHKTP